MEQGGLFYQINFMGNSQFWVDFHCHLADDRLRSHLNSEIDKANANGIKHFLSSALSNKEYQWHLKLAELHPQYGKSVFWCAGIHPYYEYSSEKDLPILRELCSNHRIVAIGEIGIDKRNPDLDWQKRIFLDQLQLAADFQLPVILHIVKSYYEVYKLIKTNFPKLTYILHGFKASLEIAQSFAEFNIYYSLNYNLPKIEVLNYIIDSKSLILETDAPYANPLKDQDHNHLENLLYNVRLLVDRTGLTIEDVKQMQYENFLNLFSG